MALTATYDATFARMRLSGTVLGAAATQAYVWRSVDGFLTFVNVRGGVGAPMSGGVFEIDDYEFPTDRPFTYRITSYDGALVAQATFSTAPISQDIAGVWLKSLTRPFLNRQITVQDISDITQRARLQIFDVVGRSAGIAVSDVRSGRELTLSVSTEDVAASDAIRFLVASGDPLFLHSPAAEDELVPTMYAAAGDVSKQLAMRRNPRRYWQLPLTEVAAPDPVVFGSQITYQGVAALYASYNALLAANATYDDLLDLVSSPSEVIVP